MCIIATWKNSNVNCNKLYINLVLKAFIQIRLRQMQDKKISHVTYIIILVVN